MSGKIPEPWYGLNLAILRTSLETMELLVGDLTRDVPPELLPEGYQFPGSE